MNKKVACLLLTTALSAFSFNFTAKAESQNTAVAYNMGGSPAARGYNTGYTTGNPAAGGFNTGTTGGYNTGTTGGFNTGTTGGFNTGTTGGYNTGTTGGYNTGTTGGYNIGTTGGYNTGTTGGYNTGTTGGFNTPATGGYNRQAGANRTNISAYQNRGSQIMGAETDIPSYAGYSGQEEQGINGQVKVSKDVYLVQDGEDLWIIMGNIKAKLNMMIYTSPNQGNGAEGMSMDKNSLAYPIIEGDR